MVTSTGQCNHIGLQVAYKYWEHIPERVINVNGTTYVGRTGYHRLNNTSILTWSTA